MSAETDWTTICPHCGYTSEDDAMCRACGALLEEELPVRSFSVREVLACVSNVLDSEDVRQEREVMKFDDEYNTWEAPEVSVNWKSFPGNIYYQKKI